MREDAGLFDVDSVRRLEAAARGGLADGVLMERAGLAAWHALLDAWPSARRIVVACGPGGNGGDGYMLARHALEAGRDVCVVTPDDGAPRHPEAQAARARFMAAGGRVVAFGGALPGGDVLVDALLGIGLAGAPSAGIAAMVAALNAQAAPVLSLDVPSGLSEADVSGEAVCAQATIEFLLPKLFLRTGAALDACGRLRLATLDVAPQGAPVAGVLGPAALAARLPPRRRDSHKGSHGRVLCVGGEEGSGGAILMTAEAALRTGAGLVRVHTRAAHVAPLLARLPEAMVSGDPVDTTWPDVVAIGSGLGLGAWGRGLWQAVCDAGLPLVVDADALGLLAADPRPLPETAVLTPHPGEAARLLGTDIPGVQRDRRRALERLVDRFGCTVVLKGAGTLVGAPGRLPMLVAAGGPGLATGGTGDVLTGVVAALVAQGHAPFDAACTGALLHACAGDAAADDGERGLRATDLMPHLRRLANP